ALDPAARGTGWVRSGPVHLNVSFRDPLAPELGAAGEGPVSFPAELVGRSDGAPWTTVRRDGGEDEPGDVHTPPEQPRHDQHGGPDDDGGRTVVLLGDLGAAELHDLALAWAERHGYPVLAEPFGRLPHGRTVVPHGVLLAGDASTLDAL